MHRRHEELRGLAHRRCSLCTAAIMAPGAGASSSCPTLLPLVNAAGWHLWANNSPLIGLGLRSMHLLTLFSYVTGFDCYAISLRGQGGSERGQLKLSGTLQVRHVRTYRDRAARFARFAIATAQRLLCVGWPLLDPHAAVLERQ